MGDSVYDFFEELLKSKISSAFVEMNLSSDLQGDPSCW